MNILTVIKVDKAAFYRFIQTEPEGRYEYEWGRIVQQQQGGTRKHVHIGARFHKIVDAQLNPAKWSIYQGRGVDTPETIRYPDIVVEPASEPDDSISTLVPALVVEVLSPTSVERDLLVKPAEYLSLASLEAYIVASQDGPECRVWVRGTDRQCQDDPAIVAGLERTIDIPALALSIPLREIYGDVFARPAPSKD